VVLKHTCGPIQLRSTLKALNDGGPRTLERVWPAGLAIFERNPDGLLAALRLYDDIDRSLAG
jgi:hypothetical protein